MIDLLPEVMRSRNALEMLSPLARHKIQVLRYSVLCWLLLSSAAACARRDSHEEARQAQESR
jgi:hypothetical protein